MHHELREIFQQRGHEVVVGGNRPFLLESAGEVWLIASGKVEVFSVRVEAGKAAGTRFHFFTAMPGDLLFGMDLGSYGHGRGLLAVGMVNTHLCRFDHTLLSELASNPRYTSVVAELIDKWVTAVSAGVSNLIHPTTDLLLEPGQNLDVASGKLFRSKEGVVWVTHTRGDLLFVGMEEVAPDPGGSVFPVTQDSWLEAMAETSVKSLATVSILETPGFWRNLEIFYRIVFKCEALNKRLAEVDEYNRLKDRVTSSQNAASRALTSLAAVLEDVEPPPAAKVNDALFLACQLVAKFQGITVKPPPDLAAGKAGKDPLNAIARHSKVRTRKVSLKGEWWRQDAGPLLGFLSGSREPVALLPMPRGGYMMHCPGKNTVVPMEASAAAGLEWHGYTFYRSFPDEAVNFWRLLKFGTRRSGRDFCSMLFLVGVGATLGVLPPLAVTLLVDSVIPDGHFGRLVQISAGLIVLALVGGAIGFARSISMLRIQGRMDHDIQTALMDRIFKLPIPFFRQFSSGDLSERTNGIQHIRETLSNTVATAVVTATMALLNFALLFYYDVKLAMVALGLIILVILPTLGAAIIQVRYQHLIADSQGRLSSLVVQLLTGISKLRVAGAELLAFAAWSRGFAEQKKTAFASRKVGYLVTTMNEVFPIVALAVLFSVMAWPTGEKPLSTGDFLGFLAAFTTFSASMLAMISAVIPALNIVPLLARVKPILDAHPEAAENKLALSEVTGRIELTELCYRYSPSSALVLNEISLEILPGEFVAIVGPSGSGKSTLLRLLLGFDKPETGAILYDGQDLEELDITSLRRQIGIVLQGSKLMPGDILFNIIGSLPLTEVDAWEAARQAGLEDDIQQMPMGMHTVIGASGSVFSGGQQQRLMIARAIASKPRILFFDEATSALDNRTQALVSESLNRLQATRLVIAHRLSTIIKADRIVVMDGGKIVESGSYEQLMQEKGLFHDLAHRQLVQS